MSDEWKFKQQSLRRNPESAEGVYRENEPLMRPMASSLLRREAAASGAGMETPRPRLVTKFPLEPRREAQEKSTPPVAAPDREAQYEQRSTGHGGMTLGGYAPAMPGGYAYEYAPGPYQPPYPGHYPAPYPPYAPVAAEGEGQPSYGFYAATPAGPVWQPYYPGYGMPQMTPYGYAPPYGAPQPAQAAYPTPQANPTSPTSHAPVTPQQVQPEFQIPPAVPVPVFQPAEPSPWRSVQAEGMGSAPSVPPVSEPAQSSYPVPQAYAAPQMSPQPEPMTASAPVSFSEPVQPQAPAAPARAVAEPENPVQAERAFQPIEAPNGEERRRRAERAAEDAYSVAPPVDERAAYAPRQSQPEPEYSQLVTRDDEDDDDSLRFAPVSAQAMPTPATVPLALNTIYAGSKAPKAKREKAHKKGSGLIWLLPLVLLLGSLSALYFTGRADALLMRVGIPTWEELSAERIPDTALPAVFMAETAPPEGDQAAEEEGSQEAVAGAGAVQVGRPAEAVVVPAGTGAGATPTLTTFTVKPDTGTAPSTLVFTMLSNNAVKAVQLVQPPRERLTAQVKSAPSGDGIVWQLEVRFDKAYSGEIRALLQGEGEGSWYDSGMSCQVNID